MLQLIYVSTASDAGAVDLPSLCAQSGRNNERHETTGVLCYDGMHFLQVLEGPKANVEDTFLRIITDPRHLSLTLLSRQMITAREFGFWAMAECDDLQAKRNILGRVRHMIAKVPGGIRQDFERRFPI